MNAAFMFCDQHFCSLLRSNQLEKVLQSTSLSSHIYELNLTAQLLNQPIKAFNNEFGEFLIEPIKVIFKHTLPMSYNGCNIAYVRIR